MNEIQTLTPEQQEYLKSLVETFIAEGKSDVEAKELALDQMRKGEENWNQVTKHFGIPDFLDDQIRKALARYSAEWNKHHPDDPIEYKLILRKRPNKNGMIASVALDLELKRNFQWKAIRSKEINFVHIREMRDTNAWKMALYEAMLQDLIAYSQTYILGIDGYRSAKSTSTGGA